MTGRHAAPESPLLALDEVERDNLRRRALALADHMETWLTASVLTFTPLYPEHGDKCSTELEEWCRSARDLLRELAR